MKSSTRLTLVCIAASSLLISCNKSKETTGDSDSETTTVTAPATPIDQAKDILGKLTTGFEKVVVALESVTDKASAETAAETIKSTSAELSILVAEAKELENKLSETEKTAMETAANASMKPLMGRMSAVMNKVMANPETAGILMPAMAEFNKAMAPPVDSPDSAPVPAK